MSQTIITKQGEKLILEALQQGKTIKLNQYKVTSEYGYEPSIEDTNIRGEVVWSSSYEGALPLEFDFASDNQLNIYVTFPPKCGPFDIGTVGIFNDDILVAEMVRTSPRHKEYKPQEESDLFKEEIIIIASSISLAIEAVDVHSIFYYGTEIYEKESDLPNINDPSNNFAIVRKYEQANGSTNSVFMYKSQTELKWLPVGVERKDKIYNFNFSIR